MIVKKGEVYYADLNPVIGCEQGGCRPVIIVQNDIGNLYSPTTIVVPVTCRTRKQKLPTHINVKGADLPKKSIALLASQNTGGITNDWYFYRFVYRCIYRSSGNVPL